MAYVCYETMPVSLISCKSFPSIAVHEDPDVVDEFPVVRLGVLFAAQSAFSIYLFNVAVWPTAVRVIGVLCYTGNKLYITADQRTTVEQPK
jgi:hypothetical protein